MLTLPTEFRSEAEKAELVRANELEFEKTVKSIIRAVNKEELKFVGLTGPTCSGKTTLAKKIIDYMEGHGKRLCVVSIDDFFLDRDVLLERTRAEGGEEIDFDSVKTIDLDAFEETVEAIESGEICHIPIYDFTTGKSESSREIDPAEYDVFLFEGIQILYPEIYSRLSKHKYKTIYICVEEGIKAGGEIFEPNEVRFLRRVVRDYFFRNAKGEFSYHLWRGVRKNEDESIFPNVCNCDYRINSAMPFELGLFKPYLERILGEIPQTNRYYKNAREMLDKISGIEEIKKEYLMEDSLYREFIPFD